MTITLEHYWMGRDKTFSKDLTDEIRKNAIIVVERVNLLLALAEKDGVLPTTDTTTGTYIASGWRPVGVNSNTANAAATSKHITGQACDLRDGPIKRRLASWAMLNHDKLEQCGIWCERPQWTPNWLHCQIVPPKSGNRIYVPSSKPPLCTALPGEPV